MCHFASSKSIFTAANQLAKSSKLNFTSPHSTCENFCSCETPPKHTCAISQLQNPIRSYKSSCKPTCEITSNLRKYQPSFKFLFKHLILSFFISHSHSNLRKSPPSCEAQKFHRIPSKGSLEVVRLKKTTPHTSAYPVEHEPLHFSHGQDKRSPSRVSISS